MIDLTNYPYPTYESDKTTAIILASLVGISLIVWIIQSIQVHFQPRRLIILILISHLTIFIELVLRAVLCKNTRKSNAAFTTSTILLAVSQRILIVANNAFLIQADNPQSSRSRIILVGSIFGVVTSGILLGISGGLSHQTSTINSSFRLRQISAAIVLLMTILFYPLWFAIKTPKSTSILAIILLSISSIMSLIVAIFLLITSFSDYYIAANEDEKWFYIFQSIPLAFALGIWVILHPNRSLLSTQQPKENLLENIDNNL